MTTILGSVYWDKNSSLVHPTSPLASLSLGPQRAVLACCRLFIQRDFPIHASFCHTIAPQAQLFPAIATHHANSGLTLQSGCFCWCCCLNSYKLHGLLLSQSSLFWYRNTFLKLHIFKPFSMCVWGEELFWVTLASSNSSFNNTKTVTKRPSFSMIPVNHSIAATLSACWRPIPLYCSKLLSGFPCPCNYKFLWGRTSFVGYLFIYLWTS